MNKSIKNSIKKQFIKCEQFQLYGNCENGDDCSRWEGHRECILY